MNKKIIVLGIILIIVVGGIFIVNTSKEDTASTITKEDNTVIKEDDTKDETNEELATATIDNLSYETVITLNGKETSSSKAWIKGNKTKIETKTEVKTSVVIIDGNKQTYISYTIGDKQAYKMDYESQKNPDTPLKFAKDDNQADDIITKNLSDETINGKICKVTQYSLPGTNDYTKIWAWKENGLMIKMETKSAGTTMTTEYKNLEIKKVKDSDFNLPKEMEIVDMIDALPGM